MPARRPVSAREAFDENRPLPAAVAEAVAVFDEKAEYAKRLTYAVELLERVRPLTGMTLGIRKDLDNFVDMMREDGWV